MSRSRPPPWIHEAVDHPVEDRPGVVAVLDVGQEITAGLGCGGAIEFERDVAHGGF
jgi:hypothetical protein